MYKFKKYIKKKYILYNNIICKLNLRNKIQ